MPIGQPGNWAGVLTGLFDGLKGAVAVWLTAYFMEKLGGISALIGHCRIGLDPGPQLLRFSLLNATKMDAGVFGREREGRQPPGLLSACGFPPSFSSSGCPGNTLSFGSRFSGDTVGSADGAGRVRCPRLPRLRSLGVCAHGVLAELILLWALRPNLKRLSTGPSAWSVRAPNAGGSGGC